MAQGSGFIWSDLLQIPLSIALGVLVGVGVGWIFARCMPWFRNEKRVGNTVRMLGVAVGLLRLESILPIPYSGLLTVLSFGLAVKGWSAEDESASMATYFGKLWTVAELFLFVLVGAAVQITALNHAGFNAVVLLGLALVIRSIGVQVPRLAPDSR